MGSAKNVRKNLDWLLSVCLSTFKEKKMMDFLIQYFIKNNRHSETMKEREAYGIFAGIVGALCNAALFIFKFILGQMSHSISITADALNNLSDVGSSLTILAGFKLANKPANEKYPFGYGRVEYISGFIVAFLMILAGLGFMKSSIHKIIRPEPIVFNTLTLITLIFSILVKLWLNRFNRRVVKITNSAAINASAFENLYDVFVTMATLFSYLISYFLNLQVDGYAGVLVSLFMAYSGINIAQNILNPLLGQKPDLGIVAEIEHKLLSYKNIKGVHDLILHDYGPNKIYASVHVEVPSDTSLPEIYNEICRAEKDIRQSENIYITIHADPVTTGAQEAAS
jgi:cation diffusion facilitator family transporter